MKTLLFGRDESERDRLSWREMQPILVRSAGLVGLAVAVVAVVSKDSFVSEPHAQPQPQVMASLAPQLASAGPVDMEPPPDDERLAAESAASEVVTKPAVVAARPQPAPVPEAAERRAKPAPAVQPVDPEAAAKAAAAAKIAAAAAAQAPAAAAETEFLAFARLPAAERFAVETPEPRKKSALWPEHAVGCPRDWVAVEKQGAADQPCAEAAPVVEETAQAADPELQNAVVERLTEVAGLQFAPRIPQARPDAPAKPVKAKARARGKGRLGPPPKCGGKKYPRWRYVNKVPTWYCK